MNQSKQYYAYIMANKRNTVFYGGMTDDLVKRVWQHKNKADKHSFTAKYNVDKLVYYEIYQDPESAIIREKQIKNLVRRKKIALIKNKNPDLKDLYEVIIK